LTPQEEEELKWLLGIVNEERTADGLRRLTLAEMARGTLLAAVQARRVIE
jgi:hypothetical protein